VLAMLSNVNVQGTAAGTAFRNMLSDLSGRTPKAIAAFKSLGISMNEIIDSSGKMKPLEDVFTRLLGGLSKKTGPEQFDVLRKIFSERGEKGAIEMIDNIIRKTDEMNKQMQEKFDGAAPTRALHTYLDTFKSMQAEITNAAGFSVLAAAEMSLTTQNQLLAISASFKTAMTAAFSDVQPQIVAVSLQLREMFNSQSFREAVSGMASSIATMVEKVVDYGKELMGLAAGYAVFKGFQLVIGAGVTAWLEYRAALVLATGAQAGLTAASIAFISTPVGLILTGIALAIGGAYLAWETYTYSAEKARKKNEELAGKSTEALIDKLTEEEKRLDDVAEARRRNISLQDLEMEKAVGMAEVASRARLATLNAQLAEQELLFKTKAQNPGESQSDFQNRAAKIVLAEAAIRKAIDTEVTGMLNLQAVRDRVKAKSAAEAAAAKPKITIPDDNPIPKPYTSLRGGRDYTNLMQETSDLFAKANAVMDREHGNRMLRLKAQHDAGLLQSAQFAEQSFDEIRRSEKEKTQLLSTIHAQQVIKLASEEARLIKEFGGKNVATWAAMSDDQIAKMTESETKSHALEVRGFLHAKKMAQQKQAAEAATLAAEIETRMIKSSADYLTEQSKQVTGITEDIKKLEDATKALSAAEATYAQTFGMRPEEVAAMKARSSAVKQWAGEVNQADRAVKALSDEFNRWSARMDAGDMSPETIDNFFNAGTLLDKAKAEREKLKEGAKKFTDLSENKARKDSIQEQYIKFADEFKGTMSDAISTAIFDGGAEGGKKLRKYLEDILIRRPFKMLIETQLESMFGSKPGSPGGLFKLFSMLNGVSSFNPSGAVGHTSTAVEEGLSSDFWGSLIGKASGGPVNPKSMYRVNEVGMEMLSVAGKDYLMTGAQSGTITPANRLGGATVTYAPQINVDSRTDQAQVYALVSKAVAAGNAKLVDDLRQARVI